MLRTRPPTYGSLRTHFQTARPTNPADRRCSSEVVSQDFLVLRMGATPVPPASKFLPEPRMLDSHLAQREHFTLKRPNYTTKGA